MSNVKNIQTIFINSANRASGSIHDLVIQLPDGLVKEDNKTQIRLSVSHWCLNRSYYTVDEGNIFSINNLNTGASSTITIAQGYYNVETFMTYLKNILGQRWQISWSESTNKYCFMSPNDGCTYSFTFVNKCGHLFGFNEGITTNPCGYAIPLFSTKPILMNVDNSLFLHTSIPLRHGGSVDNLESKEFHPSSILCVIPNLCSPFQNMYIDASNTYHFYLSVHKLDSFRLWVTDQNSSMVSLPYDYTLALRIEYLEIDQVDETLLCLEQIRDTLRYIALHPRLEK
jgi:hypothetical protein